MTAVKIVQIIWLAKAVSHKLDLKKLSVSSGFREKNDRVKVPF